MADAHPDYEKQLVSELQDLCDHNKSRDGLTEEQVSLALLLVWSDRKTDNNG